MTQSRKNRIPIYTSLSNVGGIGTTGISIAITMYSLTFLVGLDSEIMVEVDCALHDA
jgi:hypothetical protein